MRRRDYLRVAGTVPVALLAAGCTGGDAVDGPTETAVYEIEGGGGAAGPPTTESDAPEIEIQENSFEHVGDSEFVVDGVVRNASDQAFAHLEVEVRLYEAGDVEGISEAAAEQREFEYMAPTETWTFRIPFEDVDIQNVSHYSITARAEMATPTP